MSLREYLADMKNWRFRTKIKDHAYMLKADVDWMYRELSKNEFMDTDYAVRKIHARAKLIDKLITKKKRELRNKANRQPTNNQPANL